MKRRWRWWALSALGVLAVAFVWLTRPEDDLARIMSLHPTVQYIREEGVHRGISESRAGKSYRFTQPPNEVLAVIRGHYQGPQGFSAISLPSGVPATFYELTSTAGSPVTCELDVFMDDRPWFLRAWETFKARLKF